MATLDLTLEDLSAAAQACRIAAVQAEADAVKQGRSSTRPIFEASARRYRDLAATFDAVAKAQAGESRRSR